MKALRLVLLLLFPAAAEAQFFQNIYNLDYVTPRYREEFFNSGIRTRDNFSGGSIASYFYVGVGTSLLNPGLPSPNNRADRYRYVRLNKGGTMSLNNTGTEFRNSPAGSPFFNSAGYSVAEIKNAEGTGGYMACGAVSDNPVTGATVPGGSDALIVKHSSAGTITDAWRLDFGGGKEIAHCIRKSEFIADTWLICGRTKQGTLNPTRVDCFVARVDATGAVLWCFTYNFDPTSPPVDATCVANQLCEDPLTGMIYVVGFIDDVLFAPNINALAFSLDAFGGVTGATIYDAGPPAGITSDDQFTSCRFTSDGDIIVGGFSNTTSLGGFAGYKMLITELDATLGVPLMANLLVANTGTTASPIPSRCYDIIERKNTSGDIEYFLYGAAFPSTGPVQCLYKTKDTGLGIEHYLYNPVKFTTGFGIDLTPNTLSKPGLILFSSVLSTTTFSDAHIMKNYFNGAACTDYCPLNPPIDEGVSYNYPAEEVAITQTCDIVALKWKNFNHQRKVSCSQASIACGSNAKGDRGNNEMDLITGAELHVYPNPAGNKLMIEWSDESEEAMSVSILNLNGQVLFSRALSSSEAQQVITLDVQSLAAGTYMVVIRGEAVLMRKLFVKE
jgi:hypothetical protein